MLARGGRAGTAQRLLVLVNSTANALYGTGRWLTHDQDLAQDGPPCVPGWPEDRAISMGAKFA